MLLKRLVLADYQIRFHGFSLALIGALVISKVVLVMEHVPLGSWVRNQPVVVSVVLRTLLYSCGVAVVLLLEKAVEARHEYGGFDRAVPRVFHHRDIYHVWADTICLACALLGFNALSVVRRHLGEHGLTRLFLSPSQEGGAPKKQESRSAPVTSEPDVTSASKAK
jgi:hypothetical protein